MGSSAIPFWRKPVVTAALLLSLGLPALDAQALALGRVNVQSALGEPLRAEIDVPDINADEAATLKATVAGPDAFKAAGLEYNSVLSNVQVSLQRRPDGRSFLRLTSDRPMNEPFVDLILDARWATGSMVRDYTMLFDPPNLRAMPAPSAITAPLLSSGAPRNVVSPQPIAAAPASASRPAPVYLSEEAIPSTRRGAQRSTRSERAPAAPPLAVALPGPGEIVVKKGDTAAQLAARYKPAGISLDQMLVSMLSINPDAFVNGNVNRLKAGAVLDLPTAAAVADSTASADARRTIVAQSKDFNAFRRRLAQNAPGSAAPTASRKAAGTVQAQVQERNSNAAAPDKLTLSKAAAAAKNAKEELIAKEKQAKDAADRAAALTKNMQELSKLGAATATMAKPAASAAAAGAPSAATAAAGTASSAAAGAKTALATAAGAAGAALNLPAPVSASSAAKTSTPSATSSAAITAASASAAAASTAAAVQAAASASSAAKASTPTAASSAPASAQAAKPAASAPVASTAVAASATKTSTVTAAVAAPAAPAPQASASVAKASPVPPAPAPEPSLVDSLLSNPVALPAAGGLLALLGGFGAWRWRQRKKNDQKDSSFLESRLQPDSFFGASGGQRIDTNNSSAANGSASVAGGSSSMVYSPSQLDAAGDVDPVAEADVYLAYGRDLQAEEILKEALRMQPSRIAVHAKLLEIYAKRRDTKAFESLAKEVQKVSNGQGPEWDTARAMGRELDPANTLYHGGEAPRASASTPAPAKPGKGAVAAGVAAAAVSTVSMAAPAAAADDPDVDFDLDLDFASVESTPSRAFPPASDPYASTMPATKAATANAPVEPQFDIVTEDNHHTTAMGLGPDGEDPMDFGFDAPTLPVITSTARDTVKLSGPDMESFSNSLSFSSKPPVKSASTSTAPMAMTTNAGTPASPLEFDFGDLSLDLPKSGAASASAIAASAAVDAGVTGDPLETKLALAQEFREIGDNDGARAMAEEVAAQAKGALKARAQRMVADLS